MYVLTIVQGIRVRVDRRWHIIGLSTITIVGRS